MYTWAAARSTEESCLCELPSSGAKMASPSASRTFYSSCLHTFRSPLSGSLFSPNAIHRPKASITLFLEQVRILHFYLHAQVCEADGAQRSGSPFLLPVAPLLLLYSPAIDSQLSVGVCLRVIQWIQTHSDGEHWRPGSRPKWTVQPS